MFATDAQGNRVWAWTANFGELRVQRTVPSELPSVSFATIPTIPVSVVALAVTPSGDTLIAFRGLNPPSSAGVAIWKAGVPAPTTAQLFATNASYQAAVAGALDPSGSAVLVFSDGTHVLQATTANAGTDPFGEPAELGTGQSSVRGAQAADGRALFAWSDAVDASPAYNQTWIAGRAPGSAVGAPQVLMGGGGFTTSGDPAGVELAMAPNGRVVLGDQLSVIHATSGSCADFRGDTTAVAAIGSVDAAGLAALATVTLNAAETDGFRPFVGAGSDGRLAAVWGQWDDCGAANDGTHRNASFHAAFAPPSGALASIDATPLDAIAVGFRADGQLVAVGTSDLAPFGAQLQSALYDTGVPVPEPNAPWIAGCACGSLIALRRIRLAVGIQRGAA